MEQKTNNEQCENHNSVSGVPGVLLRRFWAAWLVSILIVAVAGFSVGSLFGGGSGTTSGTGQVFGFGQKAPADISTRDVNFDMFWTVWRDIKAQSVAEKISDSELFYGAVRGMVGALGDPYSVFFDPKEGSSFEDALNGSFEGIGCELGIKDGVPVVIAPLAGTPAEKAGLRPGDVIVSVDKVEVTSLPLDQIVAKIRGKAGTFVTLTIVPVTELHKTDRTPAQTKEVRIERKEITVDTVKVSEPVKDIAYIQISSFNGNTFADFKSLTKQYRANKPKGIVLDLRNNPGGYVGAAVQIAGYWVGNRNVVTERGRSQDDPVADSSGTGDFANIPTVVLVNGGSASASEIVAGALHDYGLATIVGEKSYGKGTVQDLIGLDDGSLLKLTIAKWYTPNNKSIDKEGITPDVVVEYKEPTDRKPGDVGPVSPEQDNQFQAALKALEDKAGKLPVAPSEQK